MKQKVYRGFINQPSTLQPLHKFHNRHCIVVDSGDTVVELHFTEGTIHSMIVPRIFVSKVKLSA